MQKLDATVFLEPDTQVAVLSTNNPAIDEPGIKRALASRFRYYLRCCPELDEMTVTPPALKSIEADLLRIYASRCNTVKAVKKAVRALHAVKCPYCGEPTEPVTVDHFVPKSSRPEYSLLSHNLVPSCYTCNLRKKATIWDAAGKRIFLHPFLDSFLDEPFFYISIHPQGAPASFDDPLLRIAFRKTLSSSDTTRALSHFQALRLEPRLKTHFINRIRVIRRGYRQSIVNSKLTVADVREDLTNKQQSETSVYGINCWEGIVLRSILRNSAYLKHIATVPCV